MYICITNIYKYVNIKVYPRIIILGSIVVGSATVSSSASVALCKRGALVMVALMVALRFLLPSDLFGSLEFPPMGFLGLSSAPVPWVHLGPHRFHSHGFLRLSAGSPQWPPLSAQGFLSHGIPQVPKRAFPRKHLQAIMDATL